MVFGLKHDRTTGTTQFGQWEITRLMKMGELSGTSKINWTNMVLSPGEYHMYADQSGNMYVTPKEKAA